MNNKHKAVIAVAVLIVVFAVLAWYLSRNHAPIVLAPGSETATTTLATSTPPGPAIHIKESTQFYDIDAAYPSSTGLGDAQANAAAVASMKTFEQDTIATFKSDSGLTSMTAAD